MPSRIKSALFVDFDNIFIGLEADEPRAAEEFARSVRRWLTWMESDMAVPSGDDGRPAVREILVRRCYGNPETFARYRGYFTRSGFSVVDCPPLTTRGKNSADIVMVMDILDVLTHPTRFDEFIIMSADADFTPLVLRLRMHDRRTVAIVAGNAAAAYKASCDLVVSDDEFVDRALRLPPVAPPALTRAASTAQAAPSALLDAIARRVYEEASSTGMVPGSRLPAIFREFKEFTPRSNWLGFYTLRALTENLVARRPELRITDEEMWSVAADAGRQAVGAPVQVTPSGNGSAAELRTRIVEEVRKFVMNADAPVVMARVAQAVVQSVGQVVLDSRWAGAGTFRQLLEEEPYLGLEMVSSPQPGYLFDPTRHEAPVAGEVRYENLEEVPEPLSSFIRRIAELTEVPRLNPHQYRVLFEVIAREVQRSASYDPVFTSKAVRDQMLERGESVSRQYAAFVLRGIVFTGYRFKRTGVDEAADIARAFRGNVLNLLRSAQVVLNDEELALLDAWLLFPEAAPAEHRSTAEDTVSFSNAGSVAAELAGPGAGRPEVAGDVEGGAAEALAGPHEELRWNAPEVPRKDGDSTLDAWFSEWSAHPGTAPVPDEADGGQGEFPAGSTTPWDAAKAEASGLAPAAVPAPEMGDQEDGEPAGADDVGVEGVVAHDAAEPAASDTASPPDAPPTWLWPPYRRGEEPPT